MLIDVHAHLLTEGMLNRHEFWGPFMKVQGLTVGHFSLGTKQPVKAATDAEAQANILARMSHASRRQLMAERGVDKLVMSTPSHCSLDGSRSANTLKLSLPTWIVLPSTFTSDGNRPCTLS